MKRAGSKAKPGTLTPARVSAFSQGFQQQEGGPVPRPSDALVASSSTPRIGKRRFGAAGSATAAPRGDRCRPPSSVSSAHFDHPKLRLPQSARVHITRHSPRVRPQEPADRGPFTRLGGITTGIAQRTDPLAPKGPVRTTNSTPASAAASSTGARCWRRCSYARRRPGDRRPGRPGPEVVGRRLVSAIEAHQRKPAMSIPESTFPAAAAPRRPCRREADDVEAKSPARRCCGGRQHSRRRRDYQAQALAPERPSWPPSDPRST